MLEGVFEPPLPGSDFVIPPYAPAWAGAFISPDRPCQQQYRECAAVGQCPVGDYEENAPGQRGIKGPGVGRPARTKPSRSPLPLVSVACVGTAAGTPGGPIPMLFTPVVGR